MIENELPPPPPYHSFYVSFIYLTSSTKITTTKTAITYADIKKNTPQKILSVTKIKMKKFLL